MTEDEDYDFNFNQCEEDVIKDNIKSTNKYINQLSEEQKKYHIEVLLRNDSNNLFFNRIDYSIRCIIPYTYSNYQLCFIILSLGIFFICSMISNKIFIKLRGKPCDINEASFFLIIDEDNHYHISPKRQAPFTASEIFKEDCGDIKITIFSSFHNEINCDSFISFSYRCNTYYYYKFNIEGKKKHMFAGASFDLSKTTNRDIKKIFDKKWLNEHEVLYQRNKFGPNTLNMEKTGFLSILIKQAVQPFFLYQLFSIALYIYEKYYYCYVALAAIIFILLFTSYQQYKNKIRIICFSNNDKDKYEVVKDVKVTNDGMKEPIIVLLPNEELVPGQILRLYEGSVIPCDCLLLEGVCTVIESSLTGESSCVSKEQISNNKTKFEYYLNKNSFLYSGTKIENTYNKPIIALVIGTGFNTQRGNLIQTILFPRKSNYNFYKDIMLYFIAIGTIYLICGGLVIIIYFFYNKLENGMQYLSLLDLIINELDLLTIIFPPALPICLTLGNFFYQLLLTKNRIKCCDDNRLKSAGKISKIILDKTGTLTKEDLELYGFQTVKPRSKFSSEMIFDTLELSTKLYSLFHLDYYKERFHQYLNQNESIELKEDKDKDKAIGSMYNYNMTLFLECLATCHSLEKTDDEYRGESIDVQIFNSLKWVMFPCNTQTEDSRSKNKHKQFDIMPKKYYRITEEQFFNRSSKVNSDIIYKLHVLRRFDYESKKQSMSVIVKNKFDNTIRVFIKGAPEKISSQCLPQSLPSNFYEEFNSLTLSGYRVLACAMMEIDHNEEVIEENTYQHYESNNFTFLGFIIFSNRLKKKTKEVLSDLIKGGLSPVISTGDNAFTSISVAKECSIINFNSKLWMIEQKYTELNELIIKFTSIVFHNTCKTECFEFKYYSPDKSANALLQEDDELKENVSKTNLLWRKSIFVPSKDKTLFQIINELKEEKAQLCINSNIFGTLFIKTKDKEDSNLKKPKSNNTMINADKEMPLYSQLKEIILDQSVLFYRMSPNDKTKLINLFKQNKNNIIAMCGDGANDCGALNSADIGISLKSRDGLLMTAHFMSENKSIDVIKIIVIIGKTCYENSQILLKILLLSVISISSIRVVLIYEHDDMTSSQYFFLDCAIILIGCIISSCSMPDFKKHQSRYDINRVKWPLFVSILGHSIIQFSIIIGYYFIIRINYSHYQIEFNNDANANVGDDTTYINSYFFILCCMQNLSFLFVFNYFSIQKKSIFKNKLFVIYILVILVLIMRMMSFDYITGENSTIVFSKFIELKEDDYYPQLSRLTLFGFCCVSILLVFIWEYIFLLCIQPRNTININELEDRINKPRKSSNRDKEFLSNNMLKPVLSNHNNSDREKNEMPVKYTKQSKERSDNENLIDSNGLNLTLGTHRRLK